MLEVRGLDVFYGDVQALWHATFSVKTGEIVALVGANGAGKSTTLKAVSGLVAARGGQILLDGERLDTVPSHRRPALGVAHCPEARRLFVEMTVEENLDLGALHGEARRRRERTKNRMFELFPRLAERRRQPAGSLSGGEQQMVAIARGLMALPRLLMFDEPSLGLAPILVAEVFRVIESIRAAGTTVLIVEQNVPQTLSIADRAYVLENGKITLTGSGRALLSDAHVKAAYLGL